VTGRARPCGPLLLVALVITTLSWPAGVVASVDVNAPPVAVDDPGTACFPPDLGGSFPIPEDWDEFAFAGSCNAIANDTDSDGSIVAWQIVALPSHGTLNYLPDHPEAFGYTPDPDWSTPAGAWVSDSFSYQAIDNLGATSNTATFRFWIAPFNDPPSFVSSVPSVEVAEDSGPYDDSWAPYVSAGPPNESDQTVTFHITSGETHGVVNLFSVPPTFTADGHLTFTPGPNEHGYALITGYLQDDGGLEHYSGVPDHADDTGDEVTFMITIDSVNDAPVATDDSATVVEDSGADPIAVRGNDTDPDSGTTLTVTGTTNGSKGTVAITGGGIGVSYTPNANANGSDSFTYTISDGTLTDTATVDVTITAVNDAPDAADDTTTVAEDAAATAIAVLSNDSIAPDTGETLKISATSTSSHGTVAITGGGTGLTYRPGANYNGSDTFTYTVSDGGLTDTGTVNVTITAVNDPPTAVGDSKTVAEDAAATTISVLSNDTITPDSGETLTITTTSTSAHGTVVITGGGTGLTYKPNANYNGSDSFTYTISDGTLTDTATVNVTITPINDAPNAVNDGASTAIKIGTGAGPVPINVLANDTSSPDGPEILRITAVTQGSHGTVAIIDRGTRLTYDPAGTTTGIDVFQYTLSDGHGGTDTGTVQVTVGTDASGPIVGVPEVSATRLTRAGTTRLVVSWVAYDPESGIASSLLQLKRDGAATWTTVSLTDPTATRTTMLVATGHTYQFQVRATNGIGITSSFNSGALVSV
jgi:large repetitive protein